MPRRSDNLSRPRATPLIGGLALTLLGILLFLQASGIWNVVKVDTASDTLLLYGISTLTFVAFIIFAFIFLRSLFKLSRERRAHELGSKLKTRLVMHFIAVSLLPITAMAVFSYLFFNRSLEKWFSKIPEEALQNARVVQNNARREQFQALQDKARLIADSYAGNPDALTSATLEKLRRDGGLVALVVVDSANNALAQSLAPLDSPHNDELQRTLALARQMSDKNTQLGDGQDFDAAWAPLVSGQRNLLAVSLFQATTSASAVIESSSAKFDDLKMEQRRVRRLGLMALALLTLLLLFASSWIALYLGRNIATPIMALVKASGEVAQGNLSYRVTARAEDEIALLATSFNQMTAQLDENRRALEAGATELRDKNLALRERRAYIETVLESLSAGVISFDEHDHITTLNAAAQSMLRARPEAAGLVDLFTGEDLETLTRLLARARRMGRAKEQTVLARGPAHDGETLPVSLAATALRGPTNRPHGVVLVIEDLTDLLAAQRAAAWSEVARRLAHEIKNPLTPIQLSAERISKNFKKMLAAERERHGEGVANGLSKPKSNGLSPVAQDLTGPATSPASGNLERVVEECTATITREVAGLKSMVDEFSRFARLPHAKLEPADLNAIVRQAAALYEDRLDGVQLELALAPEVPEVPLDAEQIRRVLVNLIDNALESLDIPDGTRRIVITTTHNPSRAQLRLEVADTGHGVNPAHFPRLFQPYFSTRGRGTGLGLAIVHRIITEHGGRIRARTNQPHGTRFIVDLPA